MKYKLINYISDKNNRVAMSLLTLVFAMLLLAYASVPLYNLFCRVTGFAGTPNITLEESEYVLDERIEVRFDANVSSDLNWDFYPEQKFLGKIAEFKILNQTLLKNYSIN